MGSILGLKQKGFFNGVTRQNAPLIVIRGVCGILGTITFTSCFKILPQGIGTTVIATNPIIITVIAHFSFGEPVKRFEIAAIALTFVGITLLSLSKNTTEIEQKTSTYRLGVVYGLLTSFAMASITCMSRTLKSVDTFSLQFCHMSIGLVLIVLITAFTPREGPLYSYDRSSTYYLVLFGGLTNVIAIFTYTYASQHSKSTNIALLKYIGVLYSFIADLFVFQERFTSL